MPGQSDFNLNIRVRAIGRAAFLAAGALVGLIGCSAGGGADGGLNASLGFISSGVPTPSTTDINAQKTTEYGGNSGLEQMNAATIYAAGGTGAGVRVAVIDSGIDTTHTEFAGRIDSASIDITTMGAVTDIEGHGTRVAGIIGAAKDSSTLHGVAYDSTIVAIKATESCGSPPCSLLESNVVAAVDYAVAQGVDVINMSFGSSVAHNQYYRDALRRAAQAGIVMVAAAGNYSGTDPIYPAGYAEDEFIAGYLISAISLESDNSISSFSNRCGVTQDWCLGAFGSSVPTTDMGGGYTTATGTSYSAPHISGAVAAMMSLFPTLSPAQIVQILLMTAQDLGDPTIYGQGLVDLAAAIQPIGLQEVPMSSGGSTLLGDSTLSLGPAFGDALLGTAALQNVAFTDAFGRVYSANLDARISTAKRDFGFDTIIGAPKRHDFAIPAGETLSVRMSLAEDAEWIEEEHSVPARFADAGSETGTRFENESVSVAFAASETAQIRMGHNVSPANLRGGLRGGVDDGGLFLGSTEMLSPNHTLTGSGDALSLRQSLSDDTVVTVGAFVSDGSDEDLSDVGRGSLFEMGLGHRLVPGVRLEGTVGVLEEEGAILGSDNAGAFGENGARTRYGSVSAALDIHPSIEAFGSFTMGRTTVTGVSDSLVQDWSAVQSSAFGLGLRGAGLLADRDRWGFVVGQPLRVETADATLSVPVSAAGAGGIAYVTEAVDVTPSGRELGLQLAYERSFFAETSVNAWLLGRVDPGHDASKGADVGVGVTLATPL